MPLTQLVIQSPAELADVLSDWLEELQALTVAVDFVSDGQVGVSATFEEPPDESSVIAHLAVLQVTSASKLSYQLQPVDMQDWLAMTGRTEGAGKVGGFQLLDSPSVTTRLISQRDLAVEAFGAFGDGYHATTQGCLGALSWLQARINPRRIADIGCGSGVLALAAHKLWPQAKIVASDLDPRSVATTRRNRHANGSARVRVTGGAGFSPRLVGQQAPYDLILMNILARPLSRLAFSARQHLAPGGFLVLSGLLISQIPMVLAAYRRQRLALVRQSVQDGWVTLIMRQRAN